ncbi:MAG: fimbrial protein [Mucinivorans sp.]
MMKIVNILIIALGVVLSSCTKAPMGGDEPLAEGTMQIKFTLSDNRAAQPTTPSRAGETDAGTLGENDISNLKIMFYNIGTTDETSLLVDYRNMDLMPSGPGQDDTPIEGDGFRWDPVTKMLTIKPAIDLRKKYKVVVIANWRNWEQMVDPTDYRSKVTNIKALDEYFTNMTAEDLYNSASGWIPGRIGTIIMSGATEYNYSVEPKVTVPLIRQLARIDVKITFNADFMKVYPGLRFHEYSVFEASPFIYAYNLPNCSYILDTKGSNPKFVELLKQPGNSMLNIYSARLRSWEQTVYTYENLTFGKITDNADTRKNAFCMVLRLPYTLKEGDLTTTVTENYYKFYITDPSPDAADSPHKIVRNHLYRVSVEVNGFGDSNPGDDYLHVSTKVLPWDTEDITSSDGEFLTVNRASLHLKHTIANSELVVQSHDPEHTTVAAAGGKVNVAYNKTTGAVTLSAKYDPLILELKPAYETITITAGSLTKTVKIEYEPIVWAAGDIAANHMTMAQHFVFGTPDDQKILLFTFGSRVAVTQGPWADAMVMYKQDATSDGVMSRESTTERIEDFTQRSKEYPGDPCKWVTDKNYKWRTPTLEEFVELNKPVGKDTTMYGKRGYVFHGMRDIAGKPVFLNSDFHMRLPDGSDGLRGYYWSSTAFDNDAGWDFIADEHFDESGVLQASTRVNREGRFFQFPVRCVRDFFTK